jgi:hypothetical protein
MRRIAGAIAFHAKVVVVLSTELPLLLRSI